VALILLRSSANCPILSGGIAGLLSGRRMSRSAAGIFAAADVFFAGFAFAFDFVCFFAVAFFAFAGFFVVFLLVAILFSP
jgi:hypothetical protein